MIQRQIDSQRHRQTETETKKEIHRENHRHATETGLQKGTQTGVQTDNNKIQRLTLRVYRAPAMISRRKEVTSEKTNVDVICFLTPSCVHHTSGFSKAL